MADFTLSAPGTTNSPWTPANVIVPVSTIKSDASGWRATTAGVYACFAHNAAYGAVITATLTIAANATSNGDDLLLGAFVRSGANAGAGIGIVIGAFSCGTTTWNAAGTETAISAGVGITRANSDLWSCTVSISAGTATITASQNASGVSFSANTTTTFTGEASLAAGGGFNPFNNDSLYLSQFTGTGLSGSATPTPSAGSALLSGAAGTTISGVILTPLVARRRFERSEGGILLASRKVFLPPRRAALARSLHV
jgi:hypothetical protein